MPTGREILGDYGGKLEDVAPDLLEAITDENDIEEWLHDMLRYAVTMVRYASSPAPSDSVAHDFYGGNETVLINPQTGEPFTLEDLGIDRNRAEGPTTGPYGREDVVGEVVVALYRVIHKET